VFEVGNVVPYNELVIGRAQKGSDLKSIVVGCPSKDVKHLLRCVQKQLEGTIFSNLVSELSERRKTLIDKLQQRIRSLVYTKFGRELPHKDRFSASLEAGGDGPFLKQCPNDHHVYRDDEETCTKVLNELVSTGGKRFSLSDLRKKFKTQ
jgi:hypothetical protein